MIDTHPTLKLIVLLHFAFASELENSMIVLV